MMVCAARAFASAKGVAMRCAVARLPHAAGQYECPVSSAAVYGMRRVVPKGAMSALVLVLGSSQAPLPHFGRTVPAVGSGARAVPFPGSTQSVR